MITVDVKAGDFDKGEWLYADKMFELKPDKSEVIPIYCVKSVKREETIKDNLYIRFNLSNGQTFIAVMSENDYQVIYEDFITCDDKITVDVLPLDLSEPEESSSQVDSVWLRKDSGEGSSSRVSFYVMGCVFLFLILIAANYEDTDAGSNIASLSEKDKAKVCKVYIGHLFSKPSSIINHYKTDDNGNVYVKYVRPDDKTTWQYVCDISRSKITWAGWHSDTQKWGRWRQEDTTSFTYDEPKQVVKFTMKHTNKSVTVRL